MESEDVEEVNNIIEPRGSYSSYYATGNYYYSYGSTPVYGATLAPRETLNITTEFTESHSVSIGVSIPMVSYSLGYGYTRSRKVSISRSWTNPSTTSYVRANIYPEYRNVEFDHHRYNSYIQTGYLKVAYSHILLT